ncbi:MAG: hypothetical protein A3C50_02645 [Candidatus Staskawiczbacteria bacterium RIFCSPHIGHO2_02_FULL_43_16]|uniref:Prepilin peptidase n=1 Tax=Candidatus Staskawiczbacteria bacterium RIFCSPHIGHO2_01_FULL_41_41 TaxID=1802203 RepID=A0A1G2HVY9_9BACT|nr:MAG: hypothetical protein A2822_01445 [Candidatus Staskawiczbacteria bacterium RIFCSPHIGHO2_01_FULL_41_41]OGZ68182.1 MAG: hypothetical protein A3C50_02645 [Candidatus Staskawiczbacteria bacterium RIFCSPHIGHO2_02_FULL_43_16]OGZ74972.1 MAG: hypothetical protein A3A12_04045 [Candidatus Staskawiczbacteria bacterium RIFCSPLOWO2_01_FULL_43_17b]
MSLFFTAVIFILGLCIGSFLNVVILRLEKSESIGGRSYCPHCKHPLTWFDLIPVFSFLFLGGKCRYCKAKISWQYPMVEIGTAVIFLLITNDQLPITNMAGLLNVLFLFYISSSLIIIFVYDFYHYIIPDIVLFPAIIVALPFHVSWNYLLAAMLASGFFLCIFFVSHGKWMGFGDVKLAVLLGLILGLPNILAALFLAFFFGAIIGVSLMLLNQKGLKSELPFAPFLILGTFMALFWGPEILNWYMGLFIV